MRPGGTLAAPPPRVRGARVALPPPSQGEGWGGAARGHARGAASTGTARRREPTASVLAAAAPRGADYPSVQRAQSARPRCGADGAAVAGSGAGAGRGSGVAVVSRGPTPERGPPSLRASGGLPSAVGRRSSAVVTVARAGGWYRCQSGPALLYASPGARAVLAQAAGPFLDASPWGAHLRRGASPWGRVGSGGWPVSSTRPPGACAIWAARSAGAAGQCYLLTGR